MGLGRWINERWPLSKVLYWGLHEPIPGGSRFAYVLGSSTLFLFILQIVTGIWQMFYYVPTIDHAYDSVMYLRLKVSFGWLIHGLHYWGANAFLLVMGLHVIRTFIWGAYKKPRELIWLIGVCLLILTAGLMFTGAVLPWDLMGYWAGQVGISIASTIPLVGDFIKTVMQGGSAMGQLTLMRFFVLHVAILPALTALFIIFHIVAFRQFGSVGPWNPARRARTGWFWPEQLFKDLLAVTLIFLLMIGLTAFFGAPIPGPADPLDQTYTPKPEWNFLFLYSALKAFKGPMEALGTVGLPLFLLLLLIIPPFVDRREERNPIKRPIAMICGLAFAAGIISLTIFGFVSSPSTQSAGLGEDVASAALATSAPATTTASALSPTASAGRDFFNIRGCNACHSVAGQPGLGPDLSTEGLKGRSRDWLVAQIRNPKERNPDTIMPSYRKLTSEQVDELVAYMQSLNGAPSTTQPAPIVVAQAPASRPAGAERTTPAPPVAAPGQVGPAAHMIGNAHHGQTLYNQYCMYCHGKDGSGVNARSSPTPGVIPPLRPIRKDLYADDPAEFARNVDRIIQNGAKSADSPAVMPAFGSSNALTQPQIANIEAYILQLNNVDRARIEEPGVQPRRFFFLSVGAFGGLAILLSAVYFVRNRRRA